MNFTVLQGEQKMCAGGFVNSVYAVLLKGKPEFVFCLGQFLMAFGSPGTGSGLMPIGTAGSGNGQLSNPFELAIDSGDNVYVVDNDNNRVQVFDNSGNYVTQFGNTGAAHERLHDPVGIAIDSLGDVYVADGRDTDIHVFTPIG